VLVAAAAIVWSIGMPRAAHAGMTQERMPEAGERQRELLPARPVLGTMFRARQSDGSLDPPQPGAVAAAPMACPLRLAGTRGEEKSFCPLAGASSIGHRPRGPPLARFKPSSLERT